MKLRQLGVRSRIHAYGNELQTLTCCVCEIRHPEHGAPGADDQGNNEEEDETQIYQSGGFASQWIHEVTRATMLLLFQRVVEVPQLSLFGAQQLAVDLGMLNSCALCPYYLQIAPDGYLS
jgi:hypothetical protein